MADHRLSKADAEARRGKEYAVLVDAIGAAINKAALFFHDWLDRRGQADRQQAEVDHPKEMQHRKLSCQTTMQQANADHQREPRREELCHEAELRREAGFGHARETAG